MEGRGNQTLAVTGKCLPKGSCPHLLILDEPFPQSYDSSEYQAIALSSPTTIYEISPTQEPHLLTVKTEKSQKAQEAPEAGSPHSPLFPNAATTMEAPFDQPPNTEIDHDFVEIDHTRYIPKIECWEHWQPNNVIASLSGLTGSGPLLQMDSSIDSVPLYEFKLTADHTVTISTRRPEVEAAWHDLAESYRIQRTHGQALPLSDVFCFLQTDANLPIPPAEVSSLRECVQNIAIQAVKRLEVPTFALFRDRNPVLHCEWHTFILCLRKEAENQSEMWIQYWFDSQRYAWISGHLGQVMTTQARTSVDLTINCDRDIWEPAPMYAIREHFLELNQKGAYFCCAGVGYAGEILALPQPARPPRFQLAHTS